MNANPAPSAPNPPRPRVVVSGVTRRDIIIGVLVGYYLLQPFHVSAQVSGVYAGGFIGGTISLVAVANAVGMSATDLSVATGASMIPSVLGLMTLVSLPTLGVIRRLFPATLADPGGRPVTEIEPWTDGLRTRQIDARWPAQEPTR